MKTLWGILLVIAGLVLPAVGQAQFTFTTNNGIITITRYSGSSANAVIPDTTNGYPVTIIGAGAFLSSGITNVVIPYTITNVGNGNFNSCVALTSISIDPQNPIWSSVDGVWLDKNQTTIIEFPQGKKGNYIIPSSVTSIGISAFQLCNITGIVIPNSVTNIGSSAFYECYKLTGVEIPNSVTSIGTSAFRDCHGLTNATLPDNMTSLPSSLFYVCSSLINLTIPGGVTNIGSYALASTSLQGVYFKGNAPSGSTVFYYNLNTPVVYYLPGTTNWSASFNKRPTMLWNPTIPTIGSNLGFQGNQFGFPITGTADIPIVVESSTNLAAILWTPLQNCTLTNGSIYFSDVSWANYPNSFYRIRSP